MPGEDLGVAELDADDEVAKLQSFVTVGACRQEGSEWAHFDSQSLATPLRWLQSPGAASPHVRGRFGLLSATARKGSRSRSGPSQSSR